LFKKALMRHFFIWLVGKRLLKSIWSQNLFLYVETDGKITGILPLVHIDSLLFGNTLVSIAPCVYGGIVASDDQSYLELDKEACRLAEELGVDCLEMRNRVQKNA